MVHVLLVSGMHPAVQMDDDVRERMLTELPLSMRFATQNADGLMHNVPVGFAKLDDGRLVFRTDADSVKVRNVKETGRAVGVVDIDQYPDEEDKEADLRGIMIRADTSIVDPMESFEKYDEYERQLADKYYNGEVPKNSRERSEKVHRVMVVMEPTNVIAWDYRKVNYPS